MLYCIEATVFGDFLPIVHRGNCLSPEFLRAKIRNIYCYVTTDTSMYKRSSFAYRRCLEKIGHRYSRSTQPIVTAGVPRRSLMNTNHQRTSTNILNPAKTRMNPIEIETQTFVRRCRPEDSVRRAYLFRRVYESNRQLHGLRLDDNLLMVGYSAAGTLFCHWNIRAILRAIWFFYVSYVVHALRWYLEFIAIGLVSSTTLVTCAKFKTLRPY